MKNYLEIVKEHNLNDGEADALDSSLACVVLNNRHWMDRQSYLRFLRYSIKALDIALDTENGKREKGAWVEVTTSPDLNKEEIDSIECMIMVMDIAERSWPDREGYKNYLNCAKKILETAIEEEENKNK